MNADPFTLEITATVAGVAFWVLVIWMINRWRHQRDISAPAAYLYLASLISLIAMTIGLAEILATLAGDVLVDRPELVAGPDELRRRLVPRIAVVIVATPLWALHWTIIQRRAREDAAEQRAFVRTLYLYLVLSATAMAALVLTTNVIQFAILALAGRPEYHPGDSFAALGTLIPAAAVWIAHLRLANAESPSAPGAGVPRASYYYVLAGIALFVAAAGARATATATLDAIFPSGPLLAGDPAALLVQRQAPALAAMFVGAATFYWHWVCVREELGSRIRLAYLLLVNAAGLSGVLSALIWIDREVLRFLLGHRDEAQWAFFTAAVPLLLVAGGVYLAHRPFLNAALSDRSGASFVARRLSLYALNLVGLTLLAVALAGLIRLLLEMATLGTRELGPAADWWRDRTSLFTIMALAGLPIWIVTRRRLLAAVDSGDPAEAGIWPRRLYLYGTLLVVLIFVLVNAVGVVRPLIALALGEAYTARLAGGLYIAFANTLITAVIFWHFGRMALADRTLTAAIEVEPESTGEPAPLPDPSAEPRISALVSRDAAATIRQLEAALGESINRLGHIDPDFDSGSVDLSPGRVAVIVDDIRSSPNTRILLIISPHRLDIIPYG
ncbi:MAG: DUF5671 domain-containing protein [Chloroflexota bacterium]|nr:DUF5671 domain-containing protein [Chloroflexota bacterium]